MWVGLPLAFVWLAFEVGMTEEFFFRAIVQQKLSAFFRSDVAGLMLMALIFGLVHAPGIVMRGAGVDEGLGAHPDISRGDGPAFKFSGTDGAFGLLVQTS